MSSKAKVGGHRRLSSYVVDSMKTSKPESERDSGFSDGSSGYLSAVDQMDSEDTGRRGSQAASQVAVMTGSYPSLSPMIIMNNVVLKQPNTPAPALKPWGFQPTALEMLPQPQVVFLQPVVSNSTGASHKSPADKRRKSRKYLPILKSYPKIAPHPGEGLSEKASSSSSSSRPNGLSSGQERRHRHRQRRDALPVCPVRSAKPAAPAAIPSAAAPAPPVSLSRCAPLPTPGVADTAATANPANGPGPALSRPPSASPALPPETDALVPWAWPTGPESQDDGSCLGSLPDGHSKQQRFCNTYNILHRSGLLGITLRTKELIRQNRRTQGQLEQLRQHAGLFVEAVCSDDPQVWTRLQLSMMETGSAGPEEQEGREKDTLSMLP
ncbi:CLOCK-interacting pacemaker a [Anguilla rostrata]|uniref:CLOCK-interacting pacemaker a n=1 Tax=Anguilla rostrata TaxID=7938 RepID=UPI0030D26D54